MMKMEQLYLSFTVSENLTRQRMWVIIIGTTRVKTETWQ